MEMNPHHITFATTINLARISDLFTSIDRLDPKLRDRIMMIGFVAVVGAKMRGVSPSDDSSTRVCDLIENYVNYNVFRAKCEELIRSGMAEQFIVQAVVLHVLSFAYHHGNVDKTKDAQDREAEFADSLEQKAYRETNLDKREALLSMVREMRERVVHIPGVMEEGRRNYEEFCNVVVKSLIDLGTGRMYGH